MSRRPLPWHQRGVHDITTALPREVSLVRDKHTRDGSRDWTYIGGWHVTDKPSRAEAAVTDGATGTYYVFLFRTDHEVEFHGTARTLQDAEHVIEEALAA